jgi:predicted nuclease with TOPRIM domain
MGDAWDLVDLGDEEWILGIERLERAKRPVHIKVNLLSPEQVMAVGRGELKPEDVTPGNDQGRSPANKGDSGLRQEVRALREGLKAEREEKASLREELRAMREELRALREDNRALREENRALRQLSPSEAMAK